MMLYLLLHNDQQCAHSFLLMSKARVTPLRPITSPVLELTAATLAGRMDKFWKRELKMKLQDSVFWTDSTSVLKYIQNETSRFKCFVANRVAEIRSVSEIRQWRYANSSNNPADLSSRGLKVDSFIKNQIWISGPSFLVQPQELWPVDPTDVGVIVFLWPKSKKECSGEYCASSSRV